MNSSFSVETDMRLRETELFLHIDLYETSEARSYARHRYITEHMLGHLFSDQALIC